MYFHFLFILKLIKKRKELNSISNKIYLLVTAPFFVKKEELSDEFSSSHVADSSSTFAYLDYIMNFLKVNVRDLAKAKYEDTYLLTAFKLYHVF